MPDGTATLNRGFCFSLIADLSVLVCSIDLWWYRLYWL